MENALRSCESLHKSRSVRTRSFSRTGQLPTLVAETSLNDLELYRRALATPSTSRRRSSNGDHLCQRGGSDLGRRSYQFGSGFHGRRHRKKKYLAPDLASRLTGRASSVTPDLEHDKLSKRNGAKYLLKFLQSRPNGSARSRRSLGGFVHPAEKAIGHADEPVVFACLGGLPQAQRASRTHSEPQAEPPSRALSSRPTPSTSPTARAAAGATTSPSSPTARPPELRPQDEPGEAGAQEPTEETPDETWQQDEGWTAFGDVIDAIGMTQTTKPKADR